jgi:FtsH-binding integral membrane protein
MAQYQQPAYNPTYQPVPGYSNPYGTPGYGNSPYSAPAYDVEAGSGYSEKVYNDPRSFESAHHPNLRNAFLRRVYLTLCLQFALTALIAGVCAFHQPARMTVLQSPRLFLYSSMIPGFIVLMALNFFQQNYPMNAILLFTFTALESITLGVICAMYRAMGLGDIVVTAAALTAAIFIGLTIYVYNTKTDFSFLGGFLMAGMLVMFLWGLLNIFLGWHGGFFYAAIGALLCCGLILFDTSLIILRSGYDDHIGACATLYLDVVNLFIYLLQLLASTRGDDR